MVFVAYELYKAWELGRFYQRNTHPNAHDLNIKLESINEYWHIVFCISAGSGVTAGLSLLLWFVYKTIVAAAKLSGAT